MKLLIAGDFCPQYRTAELLEQGKFEEMLGEVTSIIEQADYSLVNFECPVVNRKGTPISKSGPNLRTTAKAIDLIKYAGFNAVTLANNHFLDYGEEGVHDTLETLNKAGMAHVGGGMNLEEASQAMYINGDDGKVAIINCCEHEFSIATESTAGSNPFNPVRQWYDIQRAREQADFVVVIVHGGHEHYQLPSPRMKTTYRYFIDSGADAVINHHQHCFSGYEVYQGKPIFYGIGNFCFDRNGSWKAPWNEGYMVELSLETTGIKYELIPYYQCTADAPGVSLMEGRDKLAFLEKVENISHNILQEEELSSRFREWTQSQGNYFRTVLMPFRNRYLIAAANRKWIPDFISRKRVLKLKNLVNCESLRDCFIEFLNTEIACKK